MRKILSVRQQTERHAVLRIACEDKPKSYTVTLTTYASLGFPPSGFALTDDEFAIIVADDERYRAVKKALSVLSYSDVSESMLRLKLVRAGFSRESAEEGVRECVMQGYLDEKRHLLRFIAKEANEGMRGPYYIKRKLMAKGYSSRDISYTLERLTLSGEVDFREIFERLCEKTGATGEGRRALAYKRGFKI